MPWSETRKDDRLLLYQTRRPRLTKGDKILKHRPRRKFFRQGAKFRAETEIVKTRHVNFGIFPCVTTTSLRPGAYVEENVSSDMLRLRKSQAKKVKERWCKGSLAMLKESTQLGCVFQDSFPRKSFVREKEKLGSKRDVKFSKGAWHQ